ncbi:MAG TPA: hypothetical protein VM536_22790 [Chloroflexia bacterium]|nr:hypothetical protein [Chloroflexia bacterium]
MAKTVTMRVPTVDRATFVQIAATLAFFIAVIPGLPIHHHEPFDTWTVSPNTLSVESKKALAVRLDTLADKLLDVPVITSKAEMVAWAVEILPYMAYEGIRPSQAVVPADLILDFHLTTAAFHLGGQAACRDGEDRAIIGPVFINGRYTNPVSPRYGAESALSVLVHELIHMQGGPFCTGSSEYVEANTQIATMEVMAAMVNHGNTAVLRPLLLELRALTLASLQAALPRSEYVAFLATIADKWEMARAEKSYRFWASDEARLRELAGILDRYNTIPLDAIIEAAYDGTAERVMVEYVQTVVIGSSGLTITKKTHPLPMDDLFYLWRHLDEYVAR